MELFLKDIADHCRHQKASCIGSNGKNWLLNPGTSSQSEGYSSKWLIWLVCREPLHIMVRTYFAKDDRSWFPYSSKLPVISLCGLLLKVLPLFELFAVREGDAVDPLERLRLTVPFPVRRRILMQVK